MIPIFKKALWDSRRTILWLSVGLALFGVLMVGIFPSFADQSEQMNELLDSYPDELISILTGGESEINLSDPAGFLQIEFLPFALLIVGGMMTFQAFKAITYAERDGTMDITMSLPITRREMLLGRLLSTAVSTLIILTLVFAAVVLVSQAVEEFEIGIGSFAIAMYSMFFVIMAQVSFTYLLGSLVPSSRKFVAPVAFGVFFGMYLLNGFVGSVDALEVIEPLLIFNYQDTLGQIVANGLDVVNWIVLGAVAVVGSAGAWIMIERKQLGV